jgi:hypothetical protein
MERRGRCRRREIQISSNAAAWTTLASVTPASTNYVQYSYYLGTTNHFYLRIHHASGTSRLMIDEIQTGIWQPRPQVSVTPSLEPANPRVDMVFDPRCGRHRTLWRHHRVRDQRLVRCVDQQLENQRQSAVSGSQYYSISNIPAQAAGTIVAIT